MIKALLIPCLLFTVLRRFEELNALFVFIHRSAIDLYFPQFHNIPWLPVVALTFMRILWHLNTRKHLLLNTLHAQDVDLNLKGFLITRNSDSSIKNAFITVLREKKEQFQFDHLKFCLIKWKLLLPIQFIEGCNSMIWPILPQLY